MRLPPFPDLEVTGVAADTRRVAPGHVFVAIRGHKLDGHDFAAEAVRRGAVAVVAERPLDGAIPAGVPVVVVDDGRLALARLADAFHGEPSRRVRVVGVTGTKGKTTTTFLVRSIVRAAGRECGLLGTIAYEAFGRSTVSHNTTPDPVEVQSFLADLARGGAAHAVMEVSSHALCQRRVEGVRFAVAAFTNLKPEHLDYHRTMEEYRDAKGRLFESLGPEATAVLNADDEASARYAARTAARVLRYSARGARSAVDVAADAIEVGAGGTRFRLLARGEDAVPVALRLVGRHNVENALAAAACGLSLGLDAATVRRGLEALPAVPGRLEPVEAGQPFRVLVDYAHTDDALAKVLETGRELLNGAGGRLICVFGCGGDRDRTKRPRMGHVAERLADVAVVTSDNPRTEDPGAIIDEILRGLERPERAVVEPDRRAAIRQAVSMARPGDLVLVAGKGHETYQIVGDRVVPFDDREVAREALREVPG